MHRRDLLRSGFFLGGALSAAEVVAAAKSAPPMAFEPPHQYRARMRTLTESLKSQGLYPKN